MPLSLLIDESVDFRLTELLSPDLCQWTSIARETPGISDIEVVKRAQETRSILVTEDSDFGEWVFVHGMQSSGVIFLRYNPSEINKIGSSLQHVLKKYSTDLYSRFIVITPNKIRIRTL